MKKSIYPLLAVLALWLVLAACSPSPTPDAMMRKDATPDAMMKAATPDTMMQHATPDAMMKKDATPDSMMKKDATPDAMSAPAWFKASLVDVRTGNTFTVGGLKGKVVLVETMAQWCPKCKDQQDQVKALHAALGKRDDFASIALDIDPNENAADLKKYVQARGYDWLYAVPSTAVSREIGALYGDQYLNPTATPMLIVDRKGKVHPLGFGVKSASDLGKALEPFLKESM